jgi:ribulose 1,5-bisphosphate synthetase/thiazole synthase
MANDMNHTNDTILEKQRTTHITHRCDVLVAGAGIAGVSAAIAAARNGAKVILLEREYGLGGLATLGLITLYLPLCDGEGNQMVHGIGEELLKLSIKHGAEQNYPKAWLENGTKEERIAKRYATQFNPHLFAIELESLLVDLGVTILYGTLACGVAMDDSGKRIGAVIVENKSGRSAVAAKSVIDATGDADICKLAGVETVLYEKKNALASWYYFFSQSNVKLKMFGLADVIPDKQNQSSAKIVNEREAVIDSKRYTGVDGPEISELVINSHQKMFADIMKMRESDPACVPVTISQIPLLRMTRRIEGLYTMDDTETDVYMEDSIGTTGDWRKRGPRYEIPFRTLYGKDVKNLLAAGRDISVTDAMWDITRVIPPCAVTGEAAGIAAAICDDFAAIDIKELQHRLTAGGVRLHIDI